MRGLIRPSTSAQLRRHFQSPRVYVNSYGDVSWWRPWSKDAEPGWMRSAFVRVDPDTGLPFNTYGPRPGAPCPCPNGCGIVSR